MKSLLIISIIFMTAGCAAKKENARADAYQASPPSCSAHNDEIDCQWKDVPASWHRIVELCSCCLIPQFLGNDLVRPALFASLSTAASIYVAASLNGQPLPDSPGGYPLITSLQYWHSRQQSVPYAAYSWHRSEVSGWTRTAICPLATLSGFWDR